MRTRLASALVLIVLAAFVVHATAQPKYVLRFSSPSSKEHAWGRGAEKLKQLIAEETKGQVEVQVYHSNALGATRESLEMVRLGSTDFVLSGVAHVTRFVPELGTFVLPYLWKDTETMFTALDGRMGEMVEPLLYGKGFKLIGWCLASARCLADADGLGGGLPGSAAGRGGRSGEPAGDRVLREAAGRAEVLLAHQARERAR
jgi:TRAP-type C4-dicarboxylate transport system substrate-binding protein